MKLSLELNLKYSSNNYLSDNYRVVEAFMQEAYGVAFDPPDPSKTQKHKKAATKLLEVSSAPEQS